MKQHYCNIHGPYSSDDGCPECQNAERRLTETNEALGEQLAALSEFAVRHVTDSREKLRESLSELAVLIEEKANLSAEAACRAAYLSNNPGDFLCPECKMISLRRNASRCPICRSSIGDDYWNAIQEYEKEQRETAEREEREAKRAAEWAKERAEKDARFRREIEAEQQARKDWDAKCEKEQQAACNRNGIILFLILCLMALVSGCLYKLFS